MLNSRFLSKKIKWLVVFAVLMAVLWLVSPWPSYGRQNKRKVVLFVVNSISLADLTSAKAPNINSLINSGAIGLMNSKAANIKESANFYLSIGAGARAEAGELGGLGFNAKERLPNSLFSGLLTARDLTLQGNDLVIPDNSVVNLGANDALGRSFKYHNNIVPGLLGEALKRASKRVAVAGNADTLQDPHREITLIAMDLKGRTSLGNVSTGLNVLDRSFPGGIRTNYKKLAKQTAGFLEKADFVAVELGDSARVDYQRPLLTKRLSIKRRGEAILRADLLLASLSNEINRQGALVIIASPQPSSDAMKDLDYLTPIVIGGLDNKGKSLLTSDTTKRAGLVANIDLAPTILNYLEVDVPAEMAGNIMTAREAKSPVKFLTKRHEQIYTMRTVRTPFVITYSLLLLAGLTLVILTTRRRFSGKDVSAKSINALKIFLLFILAVPLSSLLQIPLGKDNIAISLASGFLIAILFALVAFRVPKKKPLNSLLFITTATTLVITIDALMGTILSQRSFFGSDLISGGRYYGLGNVYMGILIGSATFSLAGLANIKIFRKYLPAAGFIGLLVVGVVVGHPRVGANIGGLITGVAAALIFSQLVAERKFTWKLLGVNILVFGLLMAVILSADLPGLSVGQSHAGKAMVIIDTRGTQAITDVIIRKVSQNARGTLSFPGFLMSAMALLAFGLKNWGLKTNQSLISLFEKESPLISKAFMALIWAAVIGFIFNDTGAVTAVAIINYLLIPLSYLILGRDLSTLN